MMNSFVKNIWKDPVWSKVIAATIIGLGAWIFSQNILFTCIIFSIVLIILVILIWKRIKKAKVSQYRCGSNNRQLSATQGTESQNSSVINSHTKTKDKIVFYCVVISCCCAIFGVVWSIRIEIRPTKGELPSPICIPLVSDEPQSDTATLDDIVDETKTVIEPEDEREIEPLMIPENIITITGLAKEHFSEREAIEAARKDAYRQITDCFSNVNISITDEKSDPIFDPTIGTWNATVKITLSHP